MAALLIGTYTPRPVGPSLPSSAAYQAPSSYSISGYVYVDSAHKGVKLPGEWGISDVEMALAEYTVTNGSIGTVPDAWYYATTNAAGYYQFTGLKPGYDYTIAEFFSRKASPARQTPWAA